MGTTAQVVASIALHVMQSRPKPEVCHPAHHPAVKEICRALPGGEDAMALADATIDACDEMQNLRECVAWAWEKYDLEYDSNKNQYWVSMAHNFIQRYCYLVLFAAYALHCGVHPYFS